jgi:hypothetical protein
MIIIQKTSGVSFLRQKIFFTDYLTDNQNLTLISA